MGKEEQKRRFFGLKSFDLTVIIVIMALIIALALTSIMGNPVQSRQMVAYLYPASADAPNIWLSSLENPEDTQQLTFSTIAVYDFAVNSRGQSIAYSMRDEVSRSRDIYLLDLNSGNDRRITFCGDENAECYTPIFHPQDAVIAYVRVERESSIGNIVSNVPRIWIVDLDSGTNRPLSDNTELVGHSPVWSDDGNTIAYYSADLTAPGVMVYNFNPQINETRTLNYIPAYNGSVGALSPNGLKLVVQDVVNRGEQVFTYLKLIDFSESPSTFVNFSDPDGVTDDIAVQWHPDGQHVTVGRRYTDERWTPGYQLFQINAESGEETTLLFDENYGHYFFAWDDTGDNLLMQRLPLVNEDGTVNNQASPEIWVLDYQTGELALIAEEAYFPRWVIRN